MVFGNSSHGPPWSRTMFDSRWIRPEKLIPMKMPPHLLPEITFPVIFAEVRVLAKIPQNPFSNILLLLIERRELSSRESPNGPLWWTSLLRMSILFAFVMASMPSLLFSKILLPVMSHSPAFGPSMMPWYPLSNILFPEAISFPPSLASKPPWWFLYTSHFLTSMRASSFATSIPPPPQSWIVQFSISPKAPFIIWTPGEPIMPEMEDGSPNFPVRLQTGSPKDAAMHPRPPLHSGKSSQVVRPPEIPHWFKWIIPFFSWQTRPMFSLEKMIFSK